MNGARAGAFRPDESLALERDRADPLASYRARFHLPRRPDGRPAVYFCGNSLGAQPRGVADELRRDLDAWAERAVDAHFKGEAPWYGSHRAFRRVNGMLLGARDSETVLMNGLTVNLHLMMASFYRPGRGRSKILMEDCAFPSDTFAARSQIRWHGLDPDRELCIARPEEDEATVRTETILSLLEREGERIALVLLGGVNYYTGQSFDMARITRAARRAGCVVGYDLAHAVGNVELDLHDWGADFAVWCTYKYLNGGPGSVAGCFVHERHGGAADLPRLAGWWGNDPDRRFRMHLDSEFLPVKGADGWQVSNPPILALAPLRASLGLFEEAGMPALRAKSIALSGYLRSWVEHVADPRISILTPADARESGCQVSLRVRGEAQALFEALGTAGIVGDHRQPDVVRVAPVPLYNTFHEVWRFGRALRAWSRGGTGAV